MSSTIQRLFLATLLCAVQVPAQGVFTSPKGLETSEGEVAWQMPFGNGDVRFQQIDADHIGTPYRNVRRMAWRRDGTTGNRTSAPKSFHLRLLLAHGNHATFDTTYAGNYQDAPVVVCDRVVSFPDWGPAPAVPPAPWDFIVPFDQPWSYNGTDALLYEIQRWNDSSSGFFWSYISDHEGSPEYRPGAWNTYGIGCQITPPPRPFYWQHTSQVRTYPDRIVASYWSAGGLHLGSNVFVLLGFRRQELDAGACTKIYATPDLLIDLGPCQGPCSLELPVAFDPAFVNATFYTQAFVVDQAMPGLPVRLSNGSHHTVAPKPPVHKAKFTFDNQLGAHLRTKGLYVGIGGWATLFSY